MSKLIAAIAATFALLLGGSVALAPASFADDSQSPGCGTDPQLPPCSPEPTCSDTDAQLPPCTTPPCEPDSQMPDCTDGQSPVAVPQTSTSCVADQTRADRLQRIADRRAETIQRLREKLRASRG